MHCLYYSVRQVHDPNLPQATHGLYDGGVFEGRETFQTAVFDRTQNNIDGTSLPKSTFSVSFGALACKRLIDGGFLPHEHLPLIQETLVNEDGIKVIDSLYGNYAQAFVDVVHEVRCCCFLFP